MMQITTRTARRYKSPQFLLVTLAMIFTVVSCDKSVAPTEERLRPVRYITVSDDSAFRDRSFSGTSKSRRESRLSFKISGTVTSVPAQIGQRMRAGQLIAEIDPASYMLQAQQAQASLVEAQANERQAAANYERTKGLYANDNASLNDLEAARARAESASAVVRSSGKALEIAQLNLSYTRLKADTECSIASLSIEVNENVSAGEPVASVSCGDEFEVEIDLPESLIGRVDEYTPVSVNFAAIPNQSFSGQIREIAVASAESSAAFPVTVGINEKHSSLRSGLAADVTFQFDLSSASAGGVIVPVSAVIRDPAGTFVYLAKADGTAGEAIVRRSEVTLGELTQSGIEVISGLSVGDRVVTAGVSVVRDGQRVLIP